MHRLLPIIALFILSCESDIPEGLDFKEEMRSFVIDLSSWAKAEKPDFVIIPQNGIELLTLNGEENSEGHQSYLRAIDAQAQEDFLYGYNSDNIASPSNEIAYRKIFLDLALQANKAILITDYCWTPSFVSNSYNQNQVYGYLPFVAPERELNLIPAEINNENSLNITQLTEAQNFLYLINPSDYRTGESLVGALSETNYDLLIIDLFDTNDLALSSAQINSLKIKKNGARRMVVAYMSIGEAEDYRYYWQTGWAKDKPSWLDKENPNWKGNFKVKYWEKEWQNIIYGSSDSYLKKIIDAEFDGAYLDIIDAFEHFE